MASVTANPGRQLVPFPGGRAVLRPVAAPPGPEPILRALPVVPIRLQGGVELAELERATIDARRALEEAVVAAAIAAQRAIEVAAALEETLVALAAEEAETNRTSALPDKADADIGALTPREREVLALVAEGRSNKAIAETLFVSPNTIKTHVASLLSKLRADSRAQLAAMAARNGVALVNGTLAPLS